MPEKPYTTKGIRSRFDPASSEPYTVSRSGIGLFAECPRCFYLEKRLGIARPDTPGFSLNNAVDALLKKEFDGYRAKGTTHPLMKAFGIDAVPYPHEKLEEWRDSLRHGIKFYHVDVRNYAKYILRDGTMFEKRELLTCLRSKITMAEKEIKIA
jgi:hypothetical protein